MAKNNKLTSLRIGYAIFFYGSKACIQCEYLFPLIHYTRQMNWYEQIEVDMVTSKEEYITKISTLLSKYRFFHINYPVIEIQPIPNGPKGLVHPDTIDYIHNQIQTHFSGHDDEFLDYLDHKLPVSIFFANLMILMSTKLVFL